MRGWPWPRSSPRARARRETDESRAQGTARLIPLATAEEMRRADRRATERYGVPSVLLMENAGRGAADAIERVLGPVGGRRVVVVSGKGSNGGDGFVVARHLVGRGARVSAWLVGRVDDVRGDARVNLDALQRAGECVTEVPEPAGKTFDRLDAELAGADVIVDALLGTGVRGPATGAVAAAIEAINAAGASGRSVCALDLPSGLPSDGEAPAGPVVRARVTVTFGLPKLGLILPAGAACAGRVEIADLGIPRVWLEEGISTALLEAADVRASLPLRPADAHKGSYGHLLVVAGSVGRTGAAVLACLGALRAGTGLVTCATAASQQPVVAAQLSEPMTEPLPETAARTISTKAVERVVELLGRMDALALGPGIGLDPETRTAVEVLVREVERPMVVDADALTALAGKPGLCRAAPAPRLLTPHPGEAARLLGCTIAEVQVDRIASARRLAADSGAIVALKGARTVVAHPDGRVTLNPTGNPGMATGGTGDVLTGVAGGLLAQGVANAEVLGAAVYLHGLAGDLAAATRGQAGLVAGDVADALPAAIRRVLEADGA
jgi:ADP-dependent NAD(P)H-hydrate dehydratase / NAD(P)H-hydrate epimerase